MLFVLPHILGTETGTIAAISDIPVRLWWLSKPTNVVFLKFLEKTNIFSNIFVNNHPKYSVSNGTYCYIIEKYMDYNIINILLPSKKYKYISGWSFVINGRNSLVHFNALTKGKAGSLKIYGKKPKVRGVARNPVDHPHGGRTKTNQPEKSIWGWVAKKGK